MARLDDGQVDELVRRFRGGETALDLAAAFGVHRTTVLRHLQARGVDSGHVRLEESDMAEVVERYEAGETCQQIASDFGVHKDTVRRRLVAAGVAMRDGRFGQR